MNGPNGLSGLAVDRPEFDNGGRLALTTTRRLSQIRHDWRCNDVNGELAIDYRRVVAQWRRAVIAPNRVVGWRLIASLIGMVGYAVVAFDSPLEDGSRFITLLAGAVIGGATMLAVRDNSPRTLVSASLVSAALFATTVGYGVARIVEGDIGSAAASLVATAAWAMVVIGSTHRGSCSKPARHPAAWMRHLRPATEYDFAAGT